MCPALLNHSSSWHRAGRTPHAALLNSYNMSSLSQSRRSSSSSVPQTPTNQRHVYVVPRSESGPHISVTSETSTSDLERCLEAHGGAIKGSAEAEDDSVYFLETVASATGPRR